MHHVTKRYEISGVVGAALSNGGWVGQNVDFQHYLLIESPKFPKIFLIFHSTAHSNTKYCQQDGQLLSCDHKHKMLVIQQVNNKERNPN